MNTQRIGPQSMRPMPAGVYPNQQQAPQSRSSSTAGRLPNNKMASNGASWGYPNGGPVSAAQGARQNLPQMPSFAQSISASQPSTPLDLSDFPTLSTNSSQQTNPISLWASSNARNLAQPSGQRPGQSNLILGHQSQAHHQAQQDDLFASSSQLPSNQSGFRYLSQNPVGQSGMSQQGPADDFPPLNRNGNGDISQAVLQMQNSFGTHGQQTNGLLNQLTNSRTPSANRTDSPGGIQGLLAASRIPDMKSRASTMENDMAPFSRPPQTYRDQTGPQSGTGPPLQLPFRGVDGPGSGFPSESSDHVVEDPFIGLTELERFGIKGYLTLAKGPIPDQAALMQGVDLGSFGLDLSSSDLISKSLWSPFDEEPGRPECPAEGSYEIPECYVVHNVQPIENKIPNFSDETLFLIFYQEGGNIQQIEAAKELSRRNWRFHKRLQIWLTKDMSMNPIQISSGMERGYYTFWNPKAWEREKREFTLAYTDLELIVEEMER